MAQIPPEAFDRQPFPHVILIDASIRFHTSPHRRSRTWGRLLRRGGPFFARIDDAVLRMPGLCLLGAGRFRCGAWAFEVSDRERRLRRAQEKLDDLGDQYETAHSGSPWP
jgi:hypothetical protein